MADTPAPAGSTRATLALTVLGSGSPSPNLVRAQPAALVSWEGGSALVDCGDGVVQQLLRAGRPLAELEQVLLTHLHWDHVLGYAAFVWASWNAGRRRLRVWGPPGTAELHERLVRGFFADQAEWAIELGFDRAGWEDVAVVELAPGEEADLGGCMARAARVVHPPMEAYGYRFERGGASIVVSGDTAACDELVALARGADLLLVDACASPPPSAAPPARAALIERLRAFHASPDEAVAMGRRAGVARTVLTHLLPGYVPPSFGDDVVVAEDLTSYEVGPAPAAEARPPATAAP